MRFARIHAVAAAVLGLLCGCGKPAVAPPATPGTAPRGHLERAQPTLPTLKLWLGDQELVTEIARTRLQLSTGMMFRTNFAEGEAMLFVFARPYRASFYMRNTKVPLSAAYVDPEGTILELHDLQPEDEKPVEAASDNVQYVLETPQGWFTRHHVNVGAALRTQYGPLRAIDWTTLRPYRMR